MRRRVLLTPLMALAMLALRPADLPATGALRVCADPNNLPYSNDRLQGFENRLAALVARDLQFAGVRYTWWAQRRGFLRHTLNSGTCDLVMGLPTRTDSTLTTRPYYRSTYVFVSRRDRHLTPSSIDDPLLRRVRIGVQMVGDDGANSPPAIALARRGIVSNVAGFSVYGDYATASPAARIIDAVAAGKIGIAVAWGPMAGYFADREPVAMDVAPVPQPRDLAALPFTFEISMGVRRGDTAFRDRLDRFIIARRAEIDDLLSRYRVPRVDGVLEATP